MEIKEKRSYDKILIIVLLAAILILVVGIGYLLVSEQQIPNISTMFNKSNGEYTILLDEFVVNLKSDKSAHNYLKIKIALMFTDEEHGSAIESNINKIRDSVITNLRSKTAGDLLDGSSISGLKLDIKEDINTSLNLMAIQDVYITDIIVQ